MMPVHSPIGAGSIAAGLGAMLTGTESLSELSECLAGEYDKSEVLLVDSGTTALALALRGAISVSKSRLVAVPNYCCFDIATAAVAADSRLAMYDVSPETLGPDFEDLELALQSGASVVVVAHLYGCPVNLDRCRSLCREHGAVLIEDAAQGSGGMWRDLPLGSVGDVGVLSFGRGKGRTGGGGGALLANTAAGRAVLEQIDLVPSMSAYGYLELAKLAAQYVFGRPLLYSIPANIPGLRLGETNYKAPWPPRYMAIGCAAALLRNWDRAKEEELARIKRGQRMLKQLQGCRGVATVRIPEYATASFLRLPVLARGSARKRLGALPGVGPAYPLELQQLPALTARLVRMAPRGGARWLIDHLLTLPTHRWAIQEVGGE